MVGPAYSLARQVRSGPWASAVSAGSEPVSRCRRRRDRGSRRTDRRRRPGTRRTVGFLRVVHRVAAPPGPARVLAVHGGVGVVPRVVWGLRRVSEHAAIVPERGSRREPRGYGTGRGLAGGRRAYRTGTA